MEGAQLTILDTQQPLLSELRQQLPRIAHMIGSKSDDVALLDWNNWPREYMWTDDRDIVIGREGSFENLPFIMKGRSQRVASKGYGVLLYENRLDPSIKYAIWVMRGPNYDESYIIVPKKDLFKLRRNAVRLNKMASKDNEAPILPDGVLEKMVQNTVGFLLKSRQIEKFGVKIKRGIILDGEPGNGKTMLCRYIQKLCTQNNINWGVVTSSDIDGAYEDKALSDLFSMYTVTFFDDIDVAYMDRKKGNGKMACSLLTAMDGMSDKGHLVRIFTTNEPVSELDPAFTRPGRIDESITVEKPTRELREKLVSKVWPVELKAGIDTETLLDRTDDFSFAEMEAIRTLLVTNRIMGDGTWDLERAFREFHARRAEKKRKGGKSVGFGKI